MSEINISDLYFRKAESTRAALMAFWASTVLTVVLTVVTLLLGDMTWNVLSADAGVRVLTVLMVVLAVAVVFLDFLLRMKYKEYKDAYVMFVSAAYLTEYVRLHEIKVADVPKTALTEIIQTAYENTYFDKGEICRCLYIYCFTVLNAHPNWLDDELIL